MKTDEEFVNEIVNDNAGSAMWTDPEGWDELDQERQDRIMAMSYAHVDFCAHCGWYWWVDDMGTSKGDELICSDCVDEEDEEDE